MDHTTFWEVRDGRGAEARSCWRPDFTDRETTEAYARRTGFSFIVKRIFLGELDRPPKETIYQLKGVRKRKLHIRPIVSAHVHCLLCGGTADFEDGVAAHDWRFMHEVQHQQPCVEAWETEAGKDTKIPLRMWVREGGCSVTL